MAGLDVKTFNADLVDIKFGPSFVKSSYLNVIKSTLDSVGCFEENKHEYNLEFLNNGMECNIRKGQFTVATVTLEFRRIFFVTKRKSFLSRMKDGIISMFYDRNVTSEKEN